MKSFFSSIFHSEPFIVIKGILIFLIGPLNQQLAALLLAVGIDLIFGIEVARKHKQFKWSTLFIKVRRKAIIYGLWISMFHAFDVATGLPNSARWAVIVMLAGLEVMSAIKNTAKLGYSRLSKALEALFLSLTNSNSSLSDAATTIEELEKIQEIQEIEEIAVAEGGGTDEKETESK